MKNFKRIVLLSMSLIIILSLTGCGKKKCTTKVCIGDQCTEVEVDCETQNNPPPVEDTTPPANNTDNQTQPGTIDTNPNPVQTPPAMTDIPTLVEDPGFSYDGLLDVEQAALNVFQAIIDGDYEGLLDMVYMQDNTYIKLDDIVTYFQISNYGNLKGQNFTIVSSKATNQGYQRTVNITYMAPNVDYEQTFTLNMMLYNGKWKYVEDGFIGVDWTFKTSPGTVVTIDDKPVEKSGGGSSQDYFIVKNISKVEHKITYTLGEQTYSQYIIPYKDTADYFFQQ